MMLIVNHDLLQRHVLLVPIQSGREILGLGNRGLQSNCSVTELVDSVDSTACITCPQGTVNPLTGQSVCAACAAGLYRNTGMDARPRGDMTLLELACQIDNNS
jgi:hypothetical protein